MVRFRKIGRFISPIVIYMTACVFLAMFIPSRGYPVTARAQARDLCKEGESLFRKGNLTESVKKFEESIESDYLYDRPHYFLGLIYERQGNKEKALGEFRQAKELHPGNERYLKKLNEFEFDKVENFIGAGKYQEALEILDGLKRSEATSLKVYLYSSKVRLNLREYRQALKELDPVFDLRKNMKISATDPALGPCYAYSALARFKLGDYYRAYLDIQEAQKIFTSPTAEITRIEEMVLGPENPVATGLKEAERLFASGHFRKASEKYSDVAKLDSNARRAVEKKIQEANVKMKAQSLFTRYKKLVDQKDWAEALNVLKEIKALNISDENISGAITKLEGQMKSKLSKKEQEPLSDDQFEDALTHLKSYDLFAAEADLEDLYRRAEDCFEKQEWLTAETLFGRIVSDDPSYKDASIKFEEVRRNITRETQRPYILFGFAAAVIIAVFYIFSQILKRLPEVLTRKAIQSFHSAKRSNNWKKVAAIGAKLCDRELIKPERLKILLGLAQAYLALDKAQEAIKMATEASKLDAKSSQAHTFMAKAYLALGRNDEVAFAEYQQLYDIEPGNQQLLDALCNCYLNRSSTDKKAVDIYKRMLQKEPDRTDLLVQIGQAYIEDDRLDSEALALYEKLCSVYPEEISYHRVLARSCLAKEMYEEAVEEARFLIEENLNDQVGHEVLTEAFLRRSLVEEAVRAYEEFVEKYPGERFIQRKLDRLREKLVITTGAAPGLTTTSIKVCKKCAHMNSNIETICKNCGVTL